MNAEKLPQKSWRERKREDLEIRSNSWNKREGNSQHGMDRQRRMEKKNKTYDYYGRST